MKRTALTEPAWVDCGPEPLTNGRIFAALGLAAIVTRDPTDRGPVWHISVTATGRYPTWDELASIHDRVCPHVAMVMHLPPRAEHVNVHPTCLHLWDARA